jgi:hypothetical protein
LRVPTGRQQLNRIRLGTQPEFHNVFPGHEIRVKFAYLCLNKMPSIIAKPDFRGRREGRDYKSVVHAHPRRIDSAAFREFVVNLTLEFSCGRGSTNAERSEATKFRSSAAMER